MGPILAFLFGKFPSGYGSPCFLGHTRFCFVHSSGLWLGGWEMMLFISSRTFCRKGGTSLLHLVPPTEYCSKSRLEGPRANHSARARTHTWSEVGSKQERIKNNMFPVNKKSHFPRAQMKRIIGLDMMRSRYKFPAIYPPRHIVISQLKQSLSGY